MTTVEHYTKAVLCSLSVNSKIFILLAGTKCTLYCDHKPLAPFFTTDMSNLVLDHCTLKLQQFDIQFEHILAKKNVVGDAFSQFRTLGLYHNNGNDDTVTRDDDVVKYIVEEVHAIKLVPNSASYRMGKLNLDVL